MLILNELAEVKKILNNIDNTSCKFGKVLNLLIRYYVNNKGYSCDRAISETIDYVTPLKPGFDIKQWKPVLDGIAKSAGKKPLRDLESIPVTQTEIDKINELDDSQQKKIAFAYLVIAKINHITHNHTWVNVSDDEMLNISNVKHNMDDFLMNIHHLKEKEVITLPKSMMKTSIQVNIIDSVGEPVFEVTNLENLGWLWEYLNGAKYKFCKDCGAIFKPRSNANMHCERHEVPSSCRCEVCGRTFDIPEGGRSRRRCECCQREYRMKSEAERQRKRYEKSKNTRL